MAGRFVLLEGRQCHWCNLSLFVRLAKLCSCHARAPAYAQDLRWWCLLLVE